ncbi:protein expanded-like isoform X2 [Eriocheir sinensis]|nr:protein expanded-like isoform X2 [Eriocheir sinensis]
MQDTELFGLVVNIDGENVFADPDSKLSKYGPKAWKTSLNGMDASGEPLLQFKFRVQFYVETHLLLRDGLSRLHYYLQLRENVLLYQQPLTEEAAFLLASHALQADLGDFSEDQHHGHYFDPAHYFPSWVVERVGAGYLMDRASQLHRDNLGLTRAEAQEQYIREASQQEAPHNLHLYRLRYKKQDPTPTVVTAICARGLDIYEEDPTAPLHTGRKLIQTFQWSTIGKLTFEKKKFEVRALSYTEKLVFYTTSDEKSKHLLYLCRLTHQFNMALQPRLAELRRVQEEDQRRYRDSYIYSSDKYREMGAFSDTLGSLRGYLAKTSADQRVSVISNTSSNTTSGIVSDRMLSMDGSEDDLDSEIMINTPPAASIESGVESLTHSLSRLDSSSSSPHGHTPDFDEESLSHPSFTPPSSTPPSGGRLSGSLGMCGSDAGGASLGRAGSVHSSSSQHSASTVRSRYSLVPHRIPPKLTMGAELAHITLAPDLPHLADLPGMVADRPGDEESDLCSGMSHTQHNCCSTCCDDDNTSITSTDDADDNENDQEICKCGSCAMCILKQTSAGFLHRKLDSENSSVAAQRGDPGPHTYEDSLDSASASAQFFRRPTFASDDASVMVQPDLDESTTSTYNFSEEEYNQLDNNDDYVVLYNAHPQFQEQEESEQEAEEREERPHTPPISSHRRSPQGAALISGGASPTGSDQHDDHIDYSVESAHASLLASYSPALAISLGAYRPRASVSSTFDTDSDYVQVSGIEGPFLTMPPAPVSMSTVKTVTPVAIASSHANAPLSCDPLNRNLESNSKRSSLASPDAVISEATVASASEAPAKFIKSKPTITVQKAHTQLASTAAPSFTSVPLRRGIVHTLPQVQPRPKIDAVQSLQRGNAQVNPVGLPPPYSRNHGSNKVKVSVSGAQSNLEVPVIRKNNYLDVRASSSISEYKTRIHPEQHSTVMPRSLYLRHQQKALQQQQLKQRQHLQRLQQRLSSETVYQPAVYAKGVGVPLLPSPTLTGYHQPHHHHHAQSSGIQPQVSSYMPAQQQQQQQQQQHQQQLQQQPQQAYLYHQPYIKNFFQNPPPPAPHLGYGMGAGPGGSGYQVAVEAASPSYQCASDPGTYPPPPPPQQQQQQQQQPSQATVYTNQVSLSQIEQFKAQLYSDVDYVIYPMKDPALSRQEYMDAKQGQVIATQAQQQQQQASSSSSSSSFAYLPPPPPYRSPKLSPLYRSTPNVAATLSSCSGLATGGGGSVSLLSSYPSYQSLTSHQPGSSSGYSSMARGRCFSQQSLASSSLSSAPSGYSASTQSLTGSYEPFSEVMLRANSMLRVRSDESILSSTLADSTDSHALAEQPLPPPPPYRPKETLDGHGHAEATTGSAGRGRTRKSGGRLNLQQLRECSQFMDVPLIAALCSDTTLLTHPGRTPSIDSTSTPGTSTPPATQSDTSGSPGTRPWDLDTSTTPSLVSTDLGQSTTDAHHVKTKRKQRGVKATRRYSLSGVYTTNQVPVTHLKSKSNKTFSGVHHHPTRTGQQTPVTQEVEDPHNTKIS